jgi:hypothetical protein
MFNSLKSLAPYGIGPWAPYRYYVADKLHEMGVKPGDIICRLGNSYLFGFFWLSRFIANITHSRYSHAAIVTEVKDDIIIVDVGDCGPRRQFAPEWTDDVYGQDILIVRYDGDPLISLAAVENVKVIEKQCFGYDSSFSCEGKFYCTEMICWSYIHAGASLCDEVRIKDLPGWKWYYEFIAEINGVNPNTMVWCVGNEKIGLLSSKKLIKVGRVILPSLRRHNVKHFSP